MPTSHTPLDDILRAIFDNIGPVIVFLLFILGAIGKAIKGAATPRRPSAGSPASSRPASSPSTRTATSRPGSRPTFRASQPQRPVSSSSDQLARERTEAERFSREEKALEAGEPTALGTPLTSGQPNASTDDVFTGENVLNGGATPTALVRAIILAQALGPPRARARRNIDRFGSL